MPFEKLPRAGQWIQNWGFPFHSSLGPCVEPCAGQGSSSLTSGPAAMPTPQDSALILGFFFQFKRISQIFVRSWAGLFCWRGGDCLGLGWFCLNNNLIPEMQDLSAAHFSEHAERVNPRNSVCPGSAANPAWFVGLHHETSLDGEKSSGPAQRVSHGHFRERECGRAFMYFTGALNLHS